MVSLLAKPWPPKKALADNSAAYRLLNMHFKAILWPNERSIQIRPFPSLRCSVWQIETGTDGETGNPGLAVPDAERISADGYVPRSDRTSVGLRRTVPGPLSGELAL